MADWAKCMDRADERVEEAVRQRRNEVYATSLLNGFGLGVLAGASVGFFSPTPNLSLWIAQVSGFPTFVTGGIIGSVYSAAIAFANPAVFSTQLNNFKKDIDKCVHDYAAALGQLPPNDPLNRR